MAANNADDLTTRLKACFANKNPIEHLSGKYDAWIAELPGEHLETLKILVEQLRKRLGMFRKLTVHKFNKLAWEVRDKFLSMLKTDSLLNSDIAIINEHVGRMPINIVFPSKTQFKKWLIDKHLNIFDFVDLKYKPFSSTRALSNYSYRKELVYPLEAAKTTFLKELLENISRYRRGN